MPIVPGILPVTNLAQIQRITALCKAKLPDEMVADLNGRDDADWQFEAGIRWAARQVQELIDSVFLVFTSMSSTNRRQPRCAGASQTASLIAPRENDIAVKLLVRLAIAASMETTLHRQLKALYAGTEARTEQQRMNGYRIDAVRGDQLVEIQHGGLAAIRTKIGDLLEDYDVLVVKPLVAKKTLVRLTRKGGKEVSRRLSPKQATLLDLFHELVYFTARFPPHPRLTLEAPARRERGAPLSGPRPSAAVGARTILSLRISGCWRSWASNDSSLPPTC